MATFLEIKNEVSANIIDLPTAVSSRVGTFVNRAMRELQNKHNFRVMEALQEISTTVDTSLLGSVPSDFKELRGEPWYLREDGTVHDIVVAPHLMAALDAFETDDTGEPKLIYHGSPSAESGASSWYVYPIPDGSSDYDNGEFRIKIPYWKFLTELSADGDNNWFTNNAMEFLVFRATAHGFAADWDEERMAIWRQLAKEEFDEVVLTDKKQRLAGVDTLVPHYQGVNSPKLRI